MDRHISIKTLLGLVKASHKEDQPSTMPKVSVIINCLNGEKHVSETLDSVFAQTFDDWEIVFWDNASVDKTAEIACSYGEKVRYFRSEVTTNLGQARSWAFEKAKGEYIAILDSDDIWDPNKLKSQLDVFASNPTLGLVYCDSFLFDARGDRYRTFQVGRPKRGYVFGDLLSANFIFTSTMMYKRSALDELNCVFDTRYSRVQDYDLSLRVAYQFPIDYVDYPLSRFRMYQDDPRWRSWKASLILREIEIKEAVDNLVQSHPDIAVTHFAQLQSMYKGLDYGVAIDLWRRGQGGQARKLLGPYLKDKKFILVYLCSLIFPFQYFSWVRSLYRNNLTKLIPNR